MKILIIEGIATSGKSSLVENLSELLSDRKLAVFGELNTHIPIMNKPDELHIQFFKSLLADAVKTNADLVIFDRFHYTQAFRAKADINQYSEVEDLLRQQETLVAYLQVDEETIASRVKAATGHREEEWGEYIKTKGQSLDEIAEYYINQQRSQLMLLNESKLASKVFNTTYHNYKTVATDIIQKWYMQS